MPGPVADRLELMRATGANLEPILLVYDGGGDTAAVIDEVVAGRADAGRHGDRGRPDASGSGRSTDPALHERVARDLAPRQALIADGHHRWATYRRLQAERHAAGGRRRPVGPRAGDARRLAHLPAAGRGDPPGGRRTCRWTPRWPRPAAVFQRPAGRGRPRRGAGARCAATAGAHPFVVTDGTTVPTCSTDPDPAAVAAALPADAAGPVAVAGRERPARAAAGAGLAGRPTRRRAGRLPARRRRRAVRAARRGARRRGADAAGRRRRTCSPWRPTASGCRASRRRSARSRAPGWCCGCSTTDHRALGRAGQPVGRALHPQPPRPRCGWRRRHRPARTAGAGCRAPRPRRPAAAAPGCAARRAARRRSRGCRPSGRAAAPSRAPGRAAATPPAGTTPARRRWAARGGPARPASRPDQVHLVDVRRRRSRVVAAPATTGPPRCSVGRRCPPPRIAADGAGMGAAASDLVDEPPRLPAWGRARRRQAGGRRLSAALGGRSSASSPSSCSMTVTPASSVEPLVGVGLARRRRPRRRGRTRRPPRPRGRRRAGPRRRRRRAGPTRPGAGRASAPGPAAAGRRRRAGPGRDGRRRRR